MEARRKPAVISVMLIVADAGAAVGWYKGALGATELWNLGGVAALEIDGARFFLHEVNPNSPAEASPDRVGATSTRIELFVDDPDGLRERAMREPGIGGRGLPALVGNAPPRRLPRPLRPQLVGRRPLSTQTPGALNTGETCFHQRETHLVRAATCPRFARGKGPVTERRGGSSPCGLSSVGLPRCDESAFVGDRDESCPVVAV